MACKDCGKDKKIHAHGLCSACLMKDYRRRHPDRVRATSKRTYEKHKQRRQDESRNRDQLSILHRAFVNSCRKRGRITQIKRTDMASIFNAVSGNYFASCAYCGTLVVAGTNATIDHIAADGGEELSNLTAACKSCNSSKQDATAEAFKARLAADDVLRSHILRQNDKLLKAWLVSAMWPGSFDELVGVLFALGTEVAVPLGLQGLGAAPVTWDRGSSGTVTTIANA